MYWACFHFKTYSFGAKCVPVLCLWFFVFFQRIKFSICTSQNSSRIFWGSSCRPLSGLGETKKLCSICIKIPKYITSDPYWMQNNLLFNIPFWVHNNLKMIIKILSIIYLSLAVLFPSVLLYWHQESWVHKTRKSVHDNTKKRVNFQSPFLNDN